jgi:hypothetical protein
MGRDVVTELRPYNTRVAMGACYAPENERDMSADDRTPGNRVAGHNTDPQITRIFEPPISLFARYTYASLWRGMVVVNLYCEDADSPLERKMTMVLAFPR